LIELIELIKLLGYWVIGLLGYWVIGLLGYWVIGLLWLFNLFHILVENGDNNYRKDP